jgi:hypothetical protein
MQASLMEKIIDLAKDYGGHKILEIGTSRGNLAATLTSCGCLVTTVDRTDRGAKSNLDGLGVQCVISEASQLLSNNQQMFSMIRVDLHDNRDDVWIPLWPLLQSRLEEKGVLVLYNSHLWKIPDREVETGLRWLSETPPVGWRIDIHDEPLPGMLICRRYKPNELVA